MITRQGIVVSHLAYIALVKVMHVYSSRCSPCREVVLGISCSSDVLVSSLSSENLNNFAKVSVSGGAELSYLP